MPNKNIKYTPKNKRFNKNKTKKKGGKLPRPSPKSLYQEPEQSDPETMFADGRLEPAQIRQILREQVQVPIDDNHLRDDSYEAFNEFWMDIFTPNLDMGQNTRRDSVEINRNNLGIQVRRPRELLNMLNKLNSYLSHKLIIIDLKYLTIIKF